VKPALIHRIRVRVHRGFLQRVQPDHQIRRQPDIQSQKRIIRIETVEDVPIRRCRQPVEFHIAVAAGRLRVIRRARGVHQRALRKLRNIRQVLPGIRQAADRLRLDRRRRIGILQAQQPRLRRHLDRL
jgi:hypothetical protein